MPSTNSNDITQPGESSCTASRTRFFVLKTVGRWMLTTNADFEHHFQVLVKIE